MGKEKNKSEKTEERREKEGERAASREQTEVAWQEVAVVVAVVSLQFGGWERELHTAHRTGYTIAVKGEREAPRDGQDRSELSPSPCHRVCSH